MAQRKWNLQDIVPPERTSKQRPRRTAPSQSNSEESNNPRQKSVRSGNNSSRTRRIFILGGVAVLLLLVGFGITALLRGAEVTVFPKYKDITVGGTFTATSNPAVGELGYELISLQAESEREIAATGEEEVAIRASGPITIYNSFSTNPQRLIKNTRFESPNGDIYRIDDSVVVPGFSEDANGNRIPGEITATVYADAPGESYNLDSATRFTIPGLEGSEQFDDMYAEVAGGAVADGFEGMQVTVDDAELTQVREELQEELMSTLRERIATERPAGFTLFPDSVIFSFEQLPANESGGDRAIIREQAQLRAPLFPEAELASFLAERTITEYDAEPVRIENSGTLTFNYNATSTDLTSDTGITFNINGNARIIWTFDAAGLKNDLAGISKGGLPTVLSGYPAIQRADAVVRPFWRQAFPEDVSSITIVEKINE